MNNSGASSSQRLGSALGWMAALVSLLALVGCAAPDAPDGASSAWVTQSDETPQRKRARIRTELAVGYFEEGRDAIALEEVKQALAHDSAYAPAYNLRGLIYLRLDDPRQAEDSLRRALALAPRDGDALHNFGWLACQQGRHEEADRAFTQALASPLYAGRARTFLAQGVCLARAGRLADAERSLTRSYELDTTNPMTGFNLAQLLYRRAAWPQAQFYIRRLNNSENANSESLWLGIRVEHRVGNTVAMQQLAEQLKKRYPQSREVLAYNQGIFDE